MRLRYALRLWSLGYLNQREAQAGCVDDQFEQNDSAFAATALPASGTVTAQMCMDDDDWYSFPVTTNETITVDLVAGNPDTLAWSLVDENGNLPSSGTSDTVRSRRAGSTGRWAIRIVGNPAPYALTITSDLCANDGFEDNDDATTATPISPGGSLSAHLCLGDFDYYRIPVTAGERVEVTMTQPDVLRARNIDVFFSNAPTHTTTTSSAGGVTTTIVSYIATATGQSTFLVGLGGAEKAYDLSVSTVPVLTCAGQEVTVNIGAGDVPTAGDDVILGTSGPDVIKGLAGDDTIYGLGGDDTLRGGPGDDEILDGLGDDELFGGSGGEAVFGNGGDDTVHGHGGDDALSGGGGADTLSGGSGNDTARGQAGNDTANGGSGDDSLNGGSGDDSLFGGRGLDALNGQSGADICTGGADNDTATASCETTISVP